MADEHALAGLLLVLILILYVVIRRRNLYRRVFKAIYSTSKNNVSWAGFEASLGMKEQLVSLGLPSATTLIGRNAQQQTSEQSLEKSNLKFPGEHLIISAEYSFPRHSTPKYRNTRFRQANPVQKRVTIAL